MFQIHLFSSITGRGSSLSFLELSNMAKLYIAMYSPIDGNYGHWALYLENDGESIIFEVVGEHGTFRANSLAVNPENSNRHIRNIPVGTVNKQDIPDLVKVMENMKIDNETTEWNCQDYVLEALESLYEECIIDEDDKDYKKGTKEAKETYFGPQ